MIDTATNTVIGHHHRRRRPGQGGGQPRRRHRLRRQLVGDTVSVIDTATNTVIATITVGDGPVGVALSPNGNRLYVSNSGDNTVYVIAV